MTSKELQKLQKKIKFDAESMALCLGLTLHCYRKYLYGENKIPSTVERAALELQQINFALDITRPGRIDAAIAKEFPLWNKTRFFLT